jgi:serine/threonine protein kinase
MNHQGNADRVPPRPKAGEHLTVWRGDPNGAVWKISDFGLGAVSYVDLSSSDKIYNIKPSTGDPIYSPPEFVAEGIVSQPKDIWSLGCSFMEVLLWTLDSSGTVMDYFQNGIFNAEECKP